MIVPINLDAADRMLDEWLDADDQRRFATANWQLIRSNYAAILDAARAGVVAEEPEWEYTRQAEANGWTGPAVYRDEAHASDGLMHGWRVVRRRKAGPWVPVKQEGAEADG